MGSRTQSTKNGIHGNRKTNSTAIEKIVTEQVNELE